jgi:hypothetical protein
MANNSASSQTSPMSLLFSSGAEHGKQTSKTQASLPKLEAKQYKQLQETLHTSVKLNNIVLATATLSPTAAAPAVPAVA